MKPLVLNSSVVACFGILSLAACVPARNATPVAMLPTATPPVTASVTPTLTRTTRPTATPTPTLTQTAVPTQTPEPTNTPTPTRTPTPAPPTRTPLPDFVLRGARERYSFEEIVPLLSSPQLVSLFMRNNVRWDGGYDPRECGGNQYDPAWVVYQNGIDDCDGHAILQCYLLERNGWEAYMIGLSVEGPVGHNVCGVNTDEAILVLDNEGQMVGPFNSLAEVAKHYINKEWMMDGGTLRTARASAIDKPITDYTAPNVLGLPWTVHTY